MAGKTNLTIKGDAFHINGKPTYHGREWNGRKIEGLLMNTRMVQGMYDDVNPETRDLWAYPDTGVWDPDRNTREFIEQMPVWRDHGVISFTINLQGGSPYGYSKEQPWINSAFRPDGSLRPAYMERLKLILDAADELGMVPIVGLFYFGQERELQNHRAVVDAIDNAVNWLLDTGHENLLLEISNECNIHHYIQPLLVPEGVHEAIQQAQALNRDGRRLLVGVSYGGGARLPGKLVTQVSDYLLLHGNHVGDPDRIRKMVRDTRDIEGYTPKPILFNEDDHFDFDKPDNNFVAAVDEYASWGYFDYRFDGEGPDDGYQSVPVNWGLSSDRKRGFFKKAKGITGY